jgi:tetratricopeptide (TPR) repeat protein
VRIFRHLIFTLIIFQGICCAQVSRVDSLIAACQTAAEDTNQIHRLLQISTVYYGNGNNTGLHTYATRAKDLALKLKDQKSAAHAYNLIGVAYKEMGNFPDALNAYLKGMEIAEKYSLEKIKVNLYDNIGNVYAERGDRKTALEYFQKAIKALPDKKSKRILQTYNNIAVVYAENGDLKNAQSYFQKVYDLAKAGNDMYNMEGPIGNIGNIYMMQGDNQKALSHFNEALDLSRKMGDRNKETLWLQNLGGLYFEMGDLKNSEKYLKHGLALSDSIDALDIVAACHQQLSALYEKTGNDIEALFHYKEFVKSNDSIFNSVNSNRIIELEMNYGFRAKEAEEKLIQEKKDAVKAEEHKKNNFIILSFSLVLILLTALAVYIYKSYKAKQKANRELEDQKNIIEEKQHEILSSIHYAKRIQNALLPSENIIQKNLERLGK